MNIQIGDVESGRDTNVAGGDMTFTGIARETQVTPEVEELAKEFDQAVDREEDPGVLDQILHSLVELVPDLKGLLLRLAAASLTKVNMGVFEIGDLFKIAKK
jgi:hypothetical protein